MTSMTPELWALLGVTLVLLFAILAQQIAIDRAYGASYALSNRTSLPGAESETVARLTRLVRNHIEGLALFAPLVLIAAILNVSNTFTTIAAMVIVVTRALHFVFYAFGVTPFRSFAWGIGTMIAIPAFVYGLVSAVGLPL